MEYARLGNSDLYISKIGFGCWAIGSHGYGAVDDDESVRSIRLALSLGVNFFDTADVYGFGHSENILYKALGAKIRDVVVATKFGVNWDKNGKTFKDCSSKRIFEAVEQSLRRLNIDCIPLYQLHHYDGITPIEEILESLEKCQKSGKIRYIGFSNTSMEFIKTAQNMKRIESLQCEYNLVQRKNEKDIEICSKEMGMGIIAYSVLARGFFSGKCNLVSKVDDKDTRNKDAAFVGDELVRRMVALEKLKKIAYHYQKTPSQLAIRWVLSNFNVTCALTGIKNSDQVAENFYYGSWELKKSDMDELDNLLG
ncbi:MAG: aldo/keto reductase [uncultured bacterium]|nr:MAG: aldo/keto reductase [uncultured bacterium]